MERPKIVVIVGPTASGKSAYAVSLAKKIGGEVISADSRQVYKGLNIGTGKVTKKEMAGVPHHLLDVASPARIFTVDDFKRLGEKAIKDTLIRGKIPIIAGGTGFYIDTLLGACSLPAVPQNPVLRKRLAKKTAAELFEQLEKKDPERAGTIDPHNPVRLIRALEVVEALGKVPPHMQTKHPYDIEWIGLSVDTATLKEKIRARLLARMRRGMVAEAKRLHKSGLSYKRMKELGLEYRFLALYLEGALTKEGMLAQLETKIYQYAKRQMTYWKRNKSIRWEPVRP